jgi:Dolichyl-phosphate-mannose-protein mannosyltransferase
MEIHRPQRLASRRPVPSTLLALFAGTRLALFVLSLVALRGFAFNLHNRDHNAAFALPPAAGGSPEAPVAAGQAKPPVSRHPEPSWISVWARWDALWYMRIAEVGYGPRFAVDDLPGKYGEPPATGFYPLLPVLMRLLAPIAGTPLRAGLWIANLALLASVWMTYRIGSRLLGEEAGLAAGALLLVYPPGFFLSAPYADSLGLALSLATFSLALDGRFVGAGIFGFLCALSRPTGVLLAPAIALEWWQARRRSPTTPWTGIFASLLPIAGLATFLAWCGRSFGDPWAPFHRQETWRGTMTWPPAAWHELTSGSLSLLATRRSVIEAVAAVLFVTLGILAFRYLPPAMAAYGLGATLLPLTTSLFSFSRLALASFPVFLTAGALLRGRPALARGLEAFFGLLLAVFALLYFTWSWIG